MAPNLVRRSAEVHVDTEESRAYRILIPEFDPRTADGPWSDFVVDPDPYLAEIDPEPDDSLAANAIRHLGVLMGRDRNQRMRYLSDAGMRNQEIATLVSLVVRWLDEAGMERLGILSRTAVDSDLGPGPVLECWINWRCKLDLALLLDATPIPDWELAVAYAFAHASELVLASYWSDGVPDNGALSLVAGDDLD